MKERNNEIILYVFNKFEFSKLVTYRQWTWEGWRDN